MNRPSLDGGTSVDLRALDPSQASRPDRARGPQAQLLLQRILDSPDPVGSRPPREPASPGPQRQGGRSSWRWAMAGAACVAAAGLVVWPAGSGQPAYASWTAVPAPVSDNDRQAAGQACIAGKQDGPRHEGLPSRAELGAMTTVLAERRGDYTFTVIASDDWFGDCLDGPDGGMGTLSGLGDTATGETVIPPAGGLVTLVAGTHTTKAGAYNFVTGRVGADVASVELNAGGNSVAATVANGYFAAWWPGSDTAISLRGRLVDGTDVEGLSPRPLLGEYQVSQD